MKLWKKPEVKNLHLNQTKEGAACKNMASGASLIPNLIVYCTYWKSPSDRRCTHPEYGKFILDEAWAWPCEKYIEGTGTDTTES